VALYFAYGSNMLTRRLRERAPSARVVGPAVLRDHELHIHKKARDGSAKCNVVPHPGAVVHGVLFELDDDDWAALDRAESRGAGYERVAIDLDGRIADLYVAQPGYIDEALLPFSWYLDFVVAGAREHGLPEEYVARIERHRAVS
jgi:gamma-glutamylcyclotransferase